MLNNRAGRSSKFFSDPELQEAIQDPSRVFNTDETGVRMGQEKRNVLVKTGTKEVQHLTNGSGSRTSISVSFTVSADGGIVPPRALYKVSKNYATGKLSKMPCDGKSGKWKVSSSPKGFQTAATFINAQSGIGCTANSIFFLTFVNVDEFS